MSIRLTRNAKPEISRHRNNRNEGGWLNRIITAITPETSKPGDSRTKQKNNRNLEYVGKLYMGSSRVEVDIVWDTGSSWLTLNDARCDASCAGLVYDTTTSTDFKEPAKPHLD
jgi:hypothetical protein